MSAAFASAQDAVRIDGPGLLAVRSAAGFECRRRSPSSRCRTWNLVRSGLLVCLLLAVPAAQGRGEGPDGSEGSRWAILVAGISGDPQLQTQFLKELRDLRDALEGAFAVPRDHIFVLADDPEKDPALVARSATRENLAKASREIAGRAGKGDLLFVFLEGHGNVDGGVYKLNLIGPDPDAADLAAMLYSIPAGRFVVVNATTCSGGSIGALSRPNAVIVTATKSGHEKNRTHMGEFFVEALRNSSSDADHNGRVSILEAFTYARERVEKYYAGEGNLQTEHPVLEDDGDGRAQEKPGPENGEGLMARTTYLENPKPAASAVALSEEEAALRREARSLEGQIEALKYSKATMAESEYERKLESLLVRLAEVNARLKRK